MKFKIDENLPIEVAVALREAGHDAMNAVDQGLGGPADASVAEVLLAMPASIADVIQCESELSVRSTTG